MAPCNATYKIHIAMHDTNHYQCNEQFDTKKQDKMQWQAAMKTPQTLQIVRRACPR